MLDREIKQELIGNVAHKLTMHHILSTLKMMLVDESDQTKEGAKKHWAEETADARERAEEIVNLILATLEAGKIPAKLTEGD